MSDPIRALRKYADPEAWGRGCGADYWNGEECDTLICYEGPDAARAALAAYRWVDAPTGPGAHWFRWDANDRPSVSQVYKRREELWVVNQSPDVRVADVDGEWCPVLPPPEDD